MTVRHVVKTGTLEKKIYSSSLGFGSPLESGQIERWHFDGRARKRIPVYFGDFFREVGHKQNKTKATD